MLKVDNGVTLLRILNLDPLLPNFISIIVGFVLGVSIQFVLTKKELINKHYSLKVLILSAGSTYSIVILYDHNKWTWPLGGLIMLGCIVSVFFWTEFKEFAQAVIKNKMTEYLKRFKVKKQEDED